MKRNNRNKKKVKQVVDINQISFNIDKGVYKIIGKGSGRIVYDLENGQVVKEAKNEKGLAQNKVEFQISSMDDSGLLAKVRNISDDHKYLIMDKAERIDNMSFVWDHFHVKNNRELYRIQRIRDISLKYNLLLYDFGRAVNWGKIQEKPIIVDYGFTLQVRRRFY